MAVGVCWTAPAQYSNTMKLSGSLHPLKPLRFILVSALISQQVTSHYIHYELVSKPTKHILYILHITFDSTILSYNDNICGTVCHPSKSFNHTLFLAFPPHFLPKTEKQAHLNSMAEHYRLSEPERPCTVNPDK